MRRKPVVSPVIGRFLTTLGHSHDKHDYNQYSDATKGEGKRRFVLVFRVATTHKPLPHSASAIREAREIRGHTRDMTVCLYAESSEIISAGSSGKATSTVKRLAHAGQLVLVMLLVQVYTHTRGNFKRWAECRPVSPVVKNKRITGYFLDIF